MAHKSNRLGGRNPFKKKCNCPCCCKHGKQNAKLSQPERRRVSQNRKKVKAFVLAIKLEAKCRDCPESHPACLSFHHRDSERKLFNIGDAVREGLGIERVAEEVAKCDILCHNCHAKYHYKKDSKPN